MAHGSREWQTRVIRLMDWAKELLTPDDISNKFLFAKDDSEQTALQVASKTHNTQL
jgi:hypothetical protein